MEENRLNVGRQLLRTMLERHYSERTIDNAAGMSVFSTDPMAAKKELLDYLTENPNATDMEAYRKVHELNQKYKG